MSAPELESALRHISPDSGRDEWVRNLMGIKSERGEDGRELAEQWSKGSDRFNQQEFNATWRSIRADGGVTAASVYHAAKAAGWRPDKPIETPPKTPQKPAQRVQEPVKASALARLIADAVPLTDPRAKPVLDYLENRLGTLPAELPRLGCIPSCAYYEDGKRIADYPAMLALVRDASGTVVQAQRTYVHDGRKAPVSAPKKYMAGAFPKGAAVRLYHCTGPLARLIVGEGIETTLALRHKLGDNAPAWAMLTAGNLQSAEIPFDVVELDVAVDRDDLASASYAGPRASYELRQRMKAFYTRTRLHAPPRGTKDWADVARASNGR